MLRDFARFLSALWSEWKVLVTGGSLIAILAVWSMATGKPIPQLIQWLILGSTLLLAGFLAWRREWISNGRSFIDVDLAHLIDLYEGRTSLQVRSLVKPYIGKYVKVSGTLANVSAYGLLGFVHLDNNGARISMTLPRWKIGAYSLLPLQTRITVAGKISEVSPLNIYLRNCELLKVEPEVRQSSDQQSSIPDP